MPEGEVEVSIVETLSETSTYAEVQQSEQLKLQWEHAGQLEYIQDKTKAAAATAIWTEALLTYGEEHQNQSPHADALPVELVAQSMFLHGGESGRNKFEAFVVGLRPTDKTMNFGEYKAIVDKVSQAKLVSQINVNPA